MALFNLNLRTRLIVKELAHRKYRASSASLVAYDYPARTQLRTKVIIVDNWHKNVDERHRALVAVRPAVYHTASTACRD